MLENQFTLVRNYTLVLEKNDISVNNYLIKQLPKAIVFINRKFEVVHASDKWIDEFQFDCIDIFGKVLFKLFGGLPREFKNTLKSNFSGKYTQKRLKIRFEGSDNEQWYEWSNTPWYDANENIIGAILQTENITGLIENELKLKKLDILLGATAEITKIGSWEYDALNDKLSWCKMTRKIHEVGEDFVPSIEQGINFYKEGYSRNKISMVVYNAMQKGITWNEKLQIVTATGKEKWVIATGKPIYKNDEYIGLIGTFQDIDHQVQIDVKTRENEKLLKTLIENLPLNVFIKDKESRKILVNKEECQYLGVDSPEEVLGKTDYDFYDKETADITREDDLKVMNTLKPILGRERLTTKKNGETVTFLTSKIPLIGDDGNSYGLIGISMDISNLKQKEDELRNLINVTSLQNKKLINFAHIVSHNLRSHSANFSMLLDFLVNEKDEVEKENMIKMLVSASENLLETLDNLNEVIAITTNVNQEKKLVNLNQRIEAVKQSLKAFLINNNAKIENYISDDINIKAIPTYVDSILMNFITNAVKYSAPERPPVVKLKSESKNGYTIVSIEDNGIGIDLNKYGDKLFGMYKTFHDNQDARGIGLYITKNQIEAMNGKVIVCSEVGKGTTFNIYFNEKN